MRLIDADVLVKELLSLTWLGCDGGYHKGMADERNTTLQRISNAPTIDPISHGKWNKKEIDGGILGICSICKYPQSWWYKSNFCPNCGADMGKEDA